MGRAAAIAYAWEGADVAISYYPAEESDAREVIQLIKTEGRNPRFSELGLMVCGGRGRHSVRTPDELRAFSQKTGLDGDALARTSRLTARIDNNAVADGFQLYLHSFVIAQSGEWAVVQQGMNPAGHLARRYHWHSASVRDFVSAPHTAIVGHPQGEILNLVDTRATKAQNALLTIAKGPLTSSLNDARRSGFKES